VAVRIRIRDVEEATKDLVYDEPTAELNPLLEHGPVHDYTFSVPASVRLRYYRAGQELFFAGDMRTHVAGQCARCLAEFDFEHALPFSFVMVPREGRWAQERLDDGGDDIVWYEGEEVDLSPLLRERLLLSLPTLPLCRESCRGLCCRCGADLNAGTCGCRAEEGDPRLEVLRRLKLPS
jgi:uncharacterized protein